MNNKNQSDAPSCFVFSLYKAGSVLLNNLVRDLAELQGMKFRSISDETFQKGILFARIPSDIGMTFSATGFVFGGFRFFPTHINIPILEDCKRVFLMRDPRDILVSLYYSMKYSHPLPGTSESGDYLTHFLMERDKANSINIDDYVIAKCDQLIGALMTSLPILNDPLTRIFRYEDVIFNKEGWVADICKHFGWDIAIPAMNEVAARYNIMVSKEDPYSHIRRVEPGDYRDKLSVSTISELNKRLREVLLAFGYIQNTLYCHELLQLCSKKIVLKSGFSMAVLSTDDTEIPTHVLPIDFSEKESKFIDDGVIECLGYWLEQDGSPVIAPVKGRTVCVCYKIRLIHDVDNMLLGFSIYSVKSGDVFIGENTSSLGGIRRCAGDLLLVRWAFNGFDLTGEYVASIGISSFSSPNSFVFRQFKMRRFRVIENHFGM